MEKLMGHHLWTHALMILKSLDHWRYWIVKKILHDLAWSTIVWNGCWRDAEIWTELRFYSDIWLANPKWLRSSLHSTVASSNAGFVSGRRPTFALASFFAQWSQSLLPGLPVMPDGLKGGQSTPPFSQQDHRSGRCESQRCPAPTKLRDCFVDIVPLIQRHHFLWV